MLRLEPIPHNKGNILFATFVATTNVLSTVRTSHVLGHRLLLILDELQVVFLCLCSGGSSLPDIVLTRAD